LNPFYNKAVCQVAFMDLRPKLHATSSPQSGSDSDMGELLQHRRLTRILVVDDNADTRMLMKELLSSRGYDVMAA
jgi:PleD family two-component response regulator